MSDDLWHVWLRHVGEEWQERPELYFSEEQAMRAAEQFQSPISRSRQIERYVSAGYGRSLAEALQRGREQLDDDVANWTAR